MAATAAGMSVGKSMPLERSSLSGDGLFRGVEAVFHAGEDGRQHQVGVGVGAGQAVFDAQVAAVGLGDADARIAVFEAQLARLAALTMAP